MNVRASLQLSGNYGGAFNTGTGAVTGNFWKLTCVTACTFSAVSSNLTNFPTGVSFPAGFSIEGVFTSVAASTGTFVVSNRQY